MHAPEFIDLPHAEGSLRVPLLPSWEVTLASPPAMEVLPDPEAAIAEALRHPIEGPRLRDRVRPGDRVTLVITDATRPCPDAALLPGLVEELRAGGVEAADITVLVALGMHRRATEAELRVKLGGFFGSLRVEQAQGGELEDYRELPSLARGSLDGGGTVPPVEVPVHLHARVLDCDLLIATGIVEPHQYAGFSGGRKSVAIGCAGRPSIQALHGIPFLEHPGTRLGRLEANPLHETLEAVAGRAGLAFVLNLALDPEGRPVAAAAGPPSAVLSHLTGILETSTWAGVGREPFDAALLGVGAPKDANLYQASRALTYLAFTPRPAVREGGWIAITAACPEGAGEGAGEAEFLEGMGRGSTPTAVLAALRREGFGAGGQRAFMVARALERYRGLVIGTRTPEVARACHLEAAGTGSEAAELLRRELGERARVLIVPHGLATLAVLDQGTGSGGAGIPIRS